MNLIQGKAISIKNLKIALDKSYSKNKVKDGFGDFEVDPSLTTKETQTYVNPKTQQVLVVHRGTASLSDRAGSAGFQWQTPGSSARIGP